VLEHGLGEGPDVGDGDGGAAVEGGAGLGGGDQLLAGAGACAPLQELADGGRTGGLAGAGGAEEGDDVADDRLGHGDAAHEGLVGGELGGGQHRGERPCRASVPRATIGARPPRRGSGPRSAGVKRSSWASGSGVGALLLDRVLGREHVEGLRQRVGLAARGHARLLHRLQQRGLGLRRGAVDLVGEQEVAEHRAGDEAKVPLAGRLVLLEHLAAGDVRGHEVGGELHARELEVEGLGQAADEQGLGEAGHADEQAVAAAEQAHEQEVDDVLLADDAAVELLDEALAAGGEGGASSAPEAGAGAALVTGGAEYTPGPRDGVCQGPAIFW
jgi:hypothetical protein